MNAPVSPNWSPSNKRLVWLGLILTAVIVLYYYRQILTPLVISVIVAYLLEPVVRVCTRWSRLPRLIVIFIVYILVILGLLSIPVTAIPPIVTQISTFVGNLPGYLTRLGEFLQQPLFIGPFTIPINELQLEEIYSTVVSNLLTLIQTLGGQSLLLLTNIASATINTVVFTTLVLFVSFYLVKDYQLFFDYFMDLIPNEYQPDMTHLAQQINLTWHAFLRGQLILSTTVGTLVFVAALILGLPNALLLGLIAAVCELIPTIGPLMASIPGMLLAFFQNDASWIGQTLTPFWFLLIVAVVYNVIFQVESYYLVPRVMSRQLSLHPLVVIIGAILGASTAGIAGIFLAAPVIATIRLIVRYIYHKLTDQPPFPPLHADPQEEKQDESITVPQSAVSG